MKKIVFLLYVLSFVWACYEDKGNYDYREINQITIYGITEDTLIRCDQMDWLSIPVTLEGTQYSDTNRFSYLWEVNRQTVATTKDLNLYANFPLGENTMRFIVTDKELGTRVWRNFKINVSSSTAGDGILVLSKYQGHAELSFKRLDKEGSVFTPNYYEAIVGHRLGVEPRKIHRNYTPQEDDNNSGLQVETDCCLKNLSENTLCEIGENRCVNQSLFASGASEWFPGMTGEFNVQACLHIPSKMMGVNLMNSLFVVVDGCYWGYQYSNLGFMIFKYTNAAKKSPLGGDLSPVLFLATYNSSTTIPAPVYLFDETYGHFLSAPSQGNLSDCPNLGEYPGYQLVYGTHTNTANNSVALLSNGSQFKMLYLKMSNPQSVVAEVEVPANVVNETTSWYPVRTEPYLFFATADKLYRYNLRELESGIAPGAKDVVWDLSSAGYEGNAQITCMAVSRTEQEIVLGISRYGEDTDAMSDELKGDVVVLKLDDRSLVKKYPGVSGRPVDVMIKYQAYDWAGSKDKLHW